MQVSLRDKRNVFNTRRVHVIAHSKWMHEAAHSARLGSYASSISLIPIGVDTALFAPLPKRMCRDVLGISPDAFVVAFSAADIGDVNKRLDTLLSAVGGGLPDVDAHLLLIGGGTPPTQPGIPFTCLGHIGSDRLLALAYSSADVLVMPSTFESFGMAAAEAMSCGTPVIATATGGLMDVVSDGECGFHTAAGDVAAIRARLSILGRDRDLLAQMGEAARTRVETHFDSQHMVDAVARKYTDMLANKGDE